MSNYAKQLEEKRQRAAARRADLGFNENAPPSTTSWIAGGGLTDQPAAKPGKRMSRQHSDLASKPFADHDVADRRAAPAAAPIRETDRCPTPQKMATQNAQRNAGASATRGGRAAFFTGGDAPAPPVTSGKRIVQQPSTSDLLSPAKPAPPPARCAAAPFATTDKHQSYAARVNQARGDGRAGPRHGGNSYGGANGNGGQNVGNSLGNRNSSRVLAPPGGFSSINLFG
mmetsp:Transcript_20208/g.62277  ORF Transcript_20208/g.62277 Transcript_20208/m.62277 type:complete len:228 (-) Transcript_20208:79-762(-)